MWVPLLSQASGQLRATSGQLRASLVAQTVKNLPAMQKTWVGSLGWEDPLEKEMVTYSSMWAFMYILNEEGLADMKNFKR